MKKQTLKELYHEMVMAGYYLPAESSSIVTKHWLISINSQQEFCLS